MKKSNTVVYERCIIRLPSCLTLGVFLCRWAVLLSDYPSGFLEYKKVKNRHTIVQTQLGVMYNTLPLDKWAAKINEWCGSFTGWRVLFDSNNLLVADKDGTQSTHTTVEFIVE